MANKLTKEKIDLLIEQVLSEDFEYNVYDRDKYLKNKYVDDSMVSATGKPDLAQATSSHRAAKAIASLQPEQNELTDEDFQYIMNNIENPEIFTTSLMSQLAALKYATNDKQIAQKISAIFDERDRLVQAKSIERQTISQPQIRPISAEEGEYTGDISLILDTIFQGNPRIKGRVEKVSEISKMFYKAAGGNKQSMEKIQSLDSQTFLSYVMLMDYFVEIGKSFDAGSGAYLFEWFLAMLTGGKVLGKQTGPGGGMGAVDFEGGYGIGKGSAKYYATKSDIKQAASGFNKNELVQYIVALKKQHKEQIGQTSKGKSDPSKITMIDIYAPKVKKISDTKFKINNEQVKVSSSPKAKVPIGDHLGEKVATIYIAEVQTKSFRDMVYKSVSTDLNTMKRKLLSTFETFFMQLEKAEESCRKYSASGKLNFANETIFAVNQSKDQFQELVPQVNSQLGYDETTSEFKELPENKKNNKKSLKDLDKLIERVILYNMNK
jgi:hypothetical protein